MSGKLCSIFLRVTRIFQSFQDFFWVPSHFWGRSPPSTGTVEPFSLDGSATSRDSVVGGTQLDGGAAMGNGGIGHPGNVDD